MKKGEVFEANISEEVTGIDIKVSYANTVVSSSIGNDFYIKYTAGGNGREITAEVENGVLVIKETGKPFSLGLAASDLLIEFPAKDYESFSFKSNAGKATVSDLICTGFSSFVASGQLNCRIFADDIFAKSASGKCEFVNCTDKKAASITIESASGTHSVKGFGAERFEIVSASGSVTVEDISGKGEIHSASGTVKLRYMEWDDDLEIDVKSGKVEVTLPIASGAELDMSAVSGSFSTSLDGAASKFTGKCQCTIGGSNVHKVKARLMSGSVEIKN